MNNRFLSEAAALEAAAQRLQGQKIKNLFSARTRPYWVEAPGTGICLDYGKNLLDDATLALLLKSAATIPQKVEAMFAGAELNFTEKRAVLHTALRAQGGPHHAEVAQLGEDIKKAAAAMRSGNMVGMTGKPFTDIVNIGIGGSDLGPRMVCHALDTSLGRNTPLNLHFISNIDYTRFDQLLRSLNPETTFFIASSKSFRTPETLRNTKAAIAWLKQRYDNLLDMTTPFGTTVQHPITQHLCAITANPAAATALGIPHNQVFPLWDWVGGRYSLWSGIGLAIAFGRGYEEFEALLAGARAMDQHFRSAPLADNLPVLMALIGVWQRNFLGAKSQCITPYADALSLLTLYLQQLEMESNGKSVRDDGALAAYPTAPVIWGDVGTNGQHAYFQFLHQGNDRTAVDLIAVLEPGHDNHEAHRFLLANCLAQAEVLMNGYSPESGALSQHRNLPGNRSSNLLLLQRLDAFHLGALIALYEHKTAVQGWLWQINSFDQFGVETGKVKADAIFARLEGLSGENFDPSTEHLIKLIRGNV